MAGVLLFPRERSPASPSDRHTTIGVYLYNRMWRFGRAELVLDPEDTSALEYRAPVLPFLRGRLIHRPL